MVRRINLRNSVGRLASNDLRSASSLVYSPSRDAGQRFVDIELLDPQPIDARRLHPLDLGF